MTSSVTEATATSQTPASAYGTVLDLLNNIPMYTVMENVSYF